MKPFISFTKKLAAGAMLLFPAIAQAIMPIAPLNEPCVWPWTQPDVAPGTTWEAVKCINPKDPYERRCEKRYFHILSESEGYVKYRLTYEQNGEKYSYESSGKAKRLSCRYESFKRVDK